MNDENDREKQNAMIREALDHETRDGHHAVKAAITARPQAVAFRPERIRIEPPALPTDWVITARPQAVAFRPERIRIEPPALPTDWVINDISFVNVVHEDLIAQAYAHDRRKAARKIRQQRRRIRRINTSFGHKHGAGVPEVMKTKVALRRLPASRP